MRGDVYELEPRPAKGHEQAGDLYGVIVQSDAFPWSTVLVAPTSSRANPGPIRPQIALGQERTVVLIDQMQAVDPEKRMGRMVGRLTLADLQAVDRAIGLVLNV